MSCLEWRGDGALRVLATRLFGPGFRCREGNCGCLPDLARHVEGARYDGLGVMGRLSPPTQPSPIPDELEVTAEETALFAPSFNASRDKWPTSERTCGDAGSRVPIWLRQFRPLCMLQLNEVHWLAQKNDLQVT